MSNISHRNSIIQQRRKHTPLREYLRDILSFRSMTFYKTNAGISKYPQHPSRKLHLITPKEYKNNYPNGISDEQDYVSHQPFLDQFTRFFYSVPHSSTLHYSDNNENCDRWDIMRNWAKNIYLTIVAWDDAENVLYSLKAETKVRNIINSVNITTWSETIYRSKSVRQSFAIFYSKFIYNSSDIWFSSNLIGCSHCILCSNLENQSYCINNNQHSREEYLLKKAEIFSHKSDFDNYFAQLPNSWWIKISDNCEGQTIFHCHNVQWGYDVSHLTNWNNVFYSDGGNDSSNFYDCYDCGSDTSHHIYAVHGQAFGDHVYCSAYILTSSYMYYSYNCENCSFCLGCISLKNKQFCILNKQYTKEERYKKVDEIFWQMEKEGILWEFFPASMSPYYFNDTISYFINPDFTKEEITALWYLRCDEPSNVDIPANAEIITPASLWDYESYDAQWKRSISKDILTKVIQDEQWNIYKIIPMELEFLNKHGLPLPRIHWLNRIKDHISIY